MKDNEVVCPIYSTLIFKTKYGDIKNRSTCPTWKMNCLTLVSCTDVNGCQVSYRIALMMMFVFALITGGGSMIKMLVFTALVILHMLLF